MTAYCAPIVLRTSRFRIALPQQAARALLYHDYRNDSTASRMRSLYALHLSFSVAIPAIQPRLRLSGTNQPSLRFPWRSAGEYLQIKFGVFDFNSSDALCVKSKLIWITRPEAFRQTVTRIMLLAHCRD
ncbi:MAG: hypothetical protein KZQ59_08225 [Candidatus Thiodiazotropha sp. (ex Lucinoma aequizonata)]|nr:hypothetical protein [Candidatus Thiodiazotropha sp. (ex Lucinoma aequizonata)]MCU7894544.1 hypothetical protein [Candidatus Thiodiazotropha sp. (ex Lucinoma aequizonata)]